MENKWHLHLATPRKILDRKCKMPSLFLSAPPPPKRAPSTTLTLRSKSMTAELEELGESGGRHGMEPGGWGGACVTGWACTVPRTPPGWLTLPQEGMQPRPQASAPSPMLGAPFSHSQESTGSVPPPCAPSPPPASFVPRRPLGSLPLAVLMEELPQNSPSTDPLWLSRQALLPLWTSSLPSSGAPPDPLVCLGPWGIPPGALGPPCSLGSAFTSPCSVLPSSPWKHQGLFSLPEDAAQHPCQAGPEEGGWPGSVFPCPSSTECLPAPLFSQRSPSRPPEQI